MANSRPVPGAASATCAPWMLSSVTTPLALLAVTPITPGYAAGYRKPLLVSDAVPRLPAEATTTMSLATAYSTAERSAGGSLGRLNERLMTWAPLSAAHRMPSTRRGRRASSSSSVVKARTGRIVASLARPMMPERPGSSRAAIRLATMVPCPIVSSVAGPSTRDRPATTLPAGKWALLAETPESMTATTIPEPVAIDHERSAASTSRAAERSGTKRVTPSSQGAAWVRAGAVRSGPAAWAGAAVSARVPTAAPTAVRTALRKPGCPVIDPPQEPAEMTLCAATGSSAGPARNNSIHAAGTAVASVAL